MDDMEAQKDLENSTQRDQLGLLVQNERARRSWSAAEAARRAGIDEKTFQRIEQGRGVRVVTLAKIDELFALPDGTAASAWSLNDPDVLADALEFAAAKYDQAAHVTEAHETEMQIEASRRTDGTYYAPGTFPPGDDDYALKQSLSVVPYLSLDSLETLAVSVQTAIILRQEQQLKYRRSLLEENIRQARDMLEHTERVSSTVDDDTSVGSRAAKRQVDYWHHKLAAMEDELKGIDQRLSAEQKVFSQSVYEARRGEH